MKSLPQTSTLTRLKELWVAWPGRILRIFIAVLPIYWLVNFCDLNTVWKRLLSVNFSFWLASLAISMFSYYLGAFRWQFILRSYGASPLPGRVILLRHHLVGAYYNLLPSGLAGDVARGYRMQNCLPTIGTSYTVILVDRIAGFFGLLFIAVWAMAVFPDLPRNVFLLALDVALAFEFLVALLLLLFPYWLRKKDGLRKVASSIPILGPLILKLPPAKSLTGVLGAILVSIFIQGAGIYAAFLLANALSPEVTFLSCCRIVPFIFLLSYFPITPAAIGQREMLFVYFFGLIGVSSEKAVATSILCFSVIIAVALIGGCIRLIESIMRFNRDKSA